MLRSSLQAALFGFTTVVFCGFGQAEAALVHEYTFADPSGAVDSVGTSYGTLQGGATISNGQLRLNGSTAYVSFSDYLIPTGQAPYSVAISVNVASRQSTSGFVELVSQGSSFAPGFYIGSDGGGQYRLTDVLLTTTAPFTPGQHDLLFSTSAAGSAFFIDGDLAYSSRLQAAISPGGSPTYFGRQFEPYGEYFTGDVSSIRIYDTAMSPSQMSPVPLPSSAPMLGAALVALGAVGYGFKRRTAAA